MDALYRLSYHSNLFRIDDSTKLKNLEVGNGKSLRNLAVRVVALDFATSTNEEPNISETTEDEDDAVQGGGKDVGFGSAHYAVDSSVADTDDAEGAKNFA